MILSYIFPGQSWSWTGNGRPSWLFSLNYLIYSHNIIKIMVYYLLPLYISWSCYVSAKLFYSLLLFHYLLSHRKKFLRMLGLSFAILLLCNFAYSSIIPQVSHPPIIHIITHVFSNTLAFKAIEYVNFLI